MPSLKAIRKRIASVKNTRKITRAMKLVAAAKLRRAQDAIIAARPYAAGAHAVVSELSGVAGKDAHPLFEERAAQARGDRRDHERSRPGRRVQHERRSRPSSATPRTSCRARPRSRCASSARRRNQHFSRRNANIASFDPAPTGATALDGRARDREPRDRRLPRGQGRPRLPRLQRVQERGHARSCASSSSCRSCPRRPSDGEGQRGSQADYIYEPRKEALLDAARAALRPDPALSRGARVDRRVLRRPDDRDGERDQERRRDDQSLTLQYNRARQAAITKELLEIIGGAEALKG